jgi:hypothetical protein
VLAAGGLDSGPRSRQVFDDEAEMMRTDVGEAALAGHFLFPIVEQRDVHHAVGEIHPLRAVPVGLADALQPEHLLVELRRLLRIRNRDCDVPQLGHGRNARVLC